MLDLRMPQGVAKMSKARLTATTMVGLLLVGAVIADPRPAVADPSAARSPVEGMVTMVDVGAGSCIPCKMMAPILEDVRNEYAGRAAVVYIDVRFEREKIATYRIRTIPTQIFFDKSGAEAARHMGFMDKRAIVAQLAKLGVE